MDTKSHPLIWMLIIALIAGFGKLLASQDKLTWRLVVGRALSSGALGVTASTALIWYPEMDPIAMTGLAALLASLGTSGLERLFQSFWGKE